MNKKELALLEKAYEAEIVAALSNGIPIMQTKSKLALKLVDDEMLASAVVDYNGVTISGFF